MKWLNKLERRFGHLAIKGLIRYIIALNALVYVLMMGPTRGIVSALYLDPRLVMQGEIWRLVTFIFIPPASTPLFIFFVLYFYYMIGTALEEYWGSFRFNLYYLIGMIGTAAAAFIAGGGGTGTYLNLSLFLAFARIYPDYQLMLFFILPVKVKYLAWFNWAFIAYTVLVEPITFKAVAIVSILNYFIFFGKDVINQTKGRGRVYNNRRNFKTSIPKNHSIHKCAVCGITEKDDPNMDFRYCSSCEGDYEYCMNHLRNHEHVVKPKVINIDRNQH